MVSASAMALPLWLLGIAVAVIVYVALAFLAFQALRTVRRLISSGRRAKRLSRQAALYDGEAHPTLLDVAVARASSERQAPRTHRRAA
jgi:hypothetical protein